MKSENSLIRHENDSMWTLFLFIIHQKRKYNEITNILLILLYKSCPHKILARMLHCSLNGNVDFLGEKQASSLVTSRGHMFYKKCLTPYKTLYCIKAKFYLKAFFALAFLLLPLHLIQSHWHETRAKYQL